MSIVLFVTASVLLSKLLSSCATSFIARSLTPVFIFKAPFEMAVCHGISTLSVRFQSYTHFSL